MSRGGGRKFKQGDLISVFVYIGKNEPADRKTISKYFSIGEGSIRTILDMLVSGNLIKKHRNGNRLSINGKNLYTRLTDYITIPEQVGFDIFGDSYTSFFSLIHNPDKEWLNQFYKLRDHAIREGCYSAMLLLCENDRIIIPGVDIDYTDKRGLFGCSDGDAVIICSAEDIAAVYRGIFTIASYLSEDIDRFIRNILSLLPLHCH